MSMAYGFYWGVFYPCCSPGYHPPDSGDEPKNNGACFAEVGKPDNYCGYLFQTAELLNHYILYA